MSAQKLILLAFIAIQLALVSCQKSSEIGEMESTSYVPSTTDFVEYTIKKGQNYADQNPYKPVDTDEVKFKVRFDSTAIYSTQDPSNQEDINKLYGFSDNNEQHHKFSARFGWRWSNNALRIFTYVYNNGVASWKEMTSATIGAELNCSLKVTATDYIFTIGNITETMPRESKTPKAKGYTLYPYFGGTETAPHNVKIWIKTL
jgi:hypothetical protein